jgi:hypothetical protein
MRWFSSPARVRAAIALLVLLLFAAWVKLRAPHVVAIGTPIRHDDFMFTVTRVQQSLLRDGSSLYRVTVNVRNEAKVVNYQWRDEVAYVRAFDERGFGHNFSSSTRRSFVLAPGGDRDAHLLFRLPKSVSSAGMYFWDGIYMGDAFNGGAYTKAVVPLGPYHPPFGT